MKRFIILAALVLFVGVIYALGHVLRWSHYAGEPHVVSGVIEVPANIDTLKAQGIKYNPENYYFNKIRVTKYWRAGNFPYIEYTEVREDLGGFNKKN